MKQGSAGTSLRRILQQLPVNSLSIPKKINKIINDIFAGLPDTRPHHTLQWYSVGSRPSGLVGLLGLVGHLGLVGLVGLVGLLELVGIVSFLGLLHTIYIPSVESLQHNSQRN